MEVEGGVLTKAFGCAKGAAGGTSINQKRAKLVVTLRGSERGTYIPSRKQHASGFGGRTSTTV